MPSYQVIARKYRPQSFDEVIGQEAIVTTLKNAIKHHRLAHAYLFCGSRGTGKTTLARVFAKALNCRAPTSDGEPCNNCPSCKEIASGSSLDVLEIDGASHRGIDDIRQINETVGYASSSGKYKIYIIDEVHMLTKEAFNALLKTLEEPPPKVMFLFATTEPHKVLPTILSRCQRFNLNRIPFEKIIKKLRRIASELGVNVEDEALHLLAHRAEGGLRDAESLFDQIIAFHEGTINAETVADVLGVMPNDSLFLLDQAGKEGRLSAAFDVVEQIFSQGKDFIHFIDSLIEHFRTLLLIKLSGSNAPFLTLSDTDKKRYEASSKLYTQEQCLTILDFLVEAQGQIRFQSSPRIALEAILLRILRTHQRLPIEFLVRRLAELEEKMTGTTPPSPTATSSSEVNETMLPPPSSPPPQISKSQNQPEMKKIIPPPVQPLDSMSIDPTPTPAELGSKKIKEKTPIQVPVKEVPVTDVPSLQLVQTESPKKQQLVAPESRYETILQFAAIELEGRIQKNQVNIK